MRGRIGYLPGELPWKAGNGRGTTWSSWAECAAASLGPRRGAGRTAQADLSVPMGKLSKGNKQKVGLIQAFMHEPELLILDEPTGGLDPLVQQEFLAMVREVRTSGRTVLMSSHVLAEVEHVSDRVGIVRDGRLIAVENVSALREKAVRRVEFHFDAPSP